MQHDIIILAFFGLAGWSAASILIWMVFNPKKKINIAGFHLQGIFPAVQPGLATMAGEKASREFSLKTIEEKISGPGALDKIKPEIEKHLDFFLREKLKTVFPIISNFIGEKTITQLKGAFMNEMETLFPMLMKNYIAVLGNEINIQQKVEEKIAAIQPAEAEKIFKEIAGKQLFLARLLGACTGIILGLVCILTIWLTR